MKLIADGGSTKTEWCLCDGGMLVERFFTGGMNPYILNDESIVCILRNEVIPHCNGATVDEIFYYGAGCRDVVIPRMKNIFHSVFTNETIQINIYSDMLASARALFGNKPGIACILGTGSNSCYYDGRMIADTVPPMGYILGDEGSGADIGKHIVNAVFKRRMSDMLRDEFEKGTGLTLDEVIRRTYKESEPGRFLASLTHFAADHIEHKEISDIITSCFRRFFRNNISAYDAHDCKIGAIGSVAFYFNSLLQTAAKEEGYVIDKVIKSPMQGLLAYHDVKENK